ncbi:MAG: SagB/ThcOx family dehydrogenase [Gaiellaceae bacterium]
MNDASSVCFRSTVYGRAEGDLHDPAELYHESSKLYPALFALQGEGMARLSASPTMQEASRHPVRSNPQLPSIVLPEPQPPVTSLWSTMQARRSDPPSAFHPLRLTALATILAAGYGVSAPGRRTVPSGGALYPLELYVAVERVEGLEPGLLHFDPLRHVLEVRHEGTRSDLLETATPLPGLLTNAAAVVFLTAVFWRSRLKYGLRGYRFALLEAGHVVQNVVLMASALGVPALPLGGYYDTCVEKLLGVDGVDESIVYGVSLGGDPC